MFDYDPLWESLKKLGKVPNDLVLDKVISSATLAKMRKNGSVTIDTLSKIGKAYYLPISKIVRIHID